MIGNKLEPFKFWCQKVLPNVYDDSLSYYEYLCKMNDYLNDVIEQINTLTDNMSDYETDLTAQWTTYRDELSAQWQTYKTYIDTYFDNLDVQQEINNKLDTMATDGTLSALIEPFIGTDIQTTVNAWLTAHVDPVGSAVIVDNTLTISGAAADSKTVGDKALLNIGYYATAQQITDSGYNNADNFPIGSVITLGSTNIGVSHLPTSAFSGTIITFGGHKDINAFLGQLAFRTVDNNNKDVYYRCKYSTWSDWVHIPKVGDQVVELKGYFSNASEITASGFTDADNFPVGSVISLGAESLGVSHLPVSDFKGTIITLGGANNINAFNGQIAFDASSNRFAIYYRCRYSNYYNWVKLPTKGCLEMIGYYSTSQEITTSGYTDADNFPIGSVITLGSTNIGVSHLPTSAFSGTIVTFGGANISAFLGQIAFRTVDNNNKNVYYRCKYSTWSDWVHIPQINNSVIEMIGHFSNASEITQSGYTDADNLPIGSVISLGSSNIGVSHLPSDDFSGVIVTLGGHKNINNFNGQIAFECHANSYTTYYRNRYANWSNWAKIPKPDEAILNKNAYKALKDFVACGDSLTVSLSYKQSGVDATVKSWAKYIADECSSTCLIKASGGITTGGYLTSQLYTDAVADTKDYAILFLGTNDANQEVDVTTFTNNYTSIISGLLTNHKFVLCVSLIDQLSAGNRATYNTAIQGICENSAYAFYIDANKYNSLLTGYTNWGHCSSFGYAVLAEMIELAINDTIKANSTFFNYTIDFE